MSGSQKVKYLKGLVEDKVLCCKFHKDGGVQNVVRGDRDWEVTKATGFTNKMNVFLKENYSCEKYYF